MEITVATAPAAAASVTETFCFTHFTMRENKSSE
jgi:hypothetical protein